MSDESIVELIRRVAREEGIDPELAIATARMESGLNPTAIGDSGCSHGLFQLNRCGGEGTGWSIADLQDPEKNARRALNEFAIQMRADPGLSGGELAARAQRPADAVGYARKINAMLAGIGSGGGTTSVVPETPSTNPNDAGTTPREGGAGANVTTNNFGLPEELANRIRMTLGSLLVLRSKGGITDAGIAHNLQSLFPEVPAATLRSIVASSGKSTDDALASTPVIGGASTAAAGLPKAIADATKALPAGLGDLAKKATDSLTFLSTPSTWWKGAFLVGGAALVVIGARMYLGGTSERTIEPAQGGAA